MKKRLHLVANWKSHKRLDEAENFLKSYSIKSDHQVIICPPMPYLFSLSEQMKSKGLSLGAQDVSNFPYGAYTGAVSADMLKGWVDYVIVGHSERRKYFGETNDMAVNKVRQAIEAEIIPIVCIDEPYVEAQLAFFEKAEFSKIIFAYEPLTAIGSGKPDTPEHAEEVAIKIGRLAQVDVGVIYGGSVDITNIRAFTDQDHIRGVLVGGSSLNVNDWESLVQAVS